MNFIEKREKELKSPQNIERMFKYFNERKTKNMDFESILRYTLNFLGADLDDVSDELWNKLKEL